MSIDALLPRIHAAQERGAIVLIKWDGERRNFGSTVVILFPPTDWSWRRDTDDMVAALTDGLNEFEALPAPPGSSVGQAKA